MLLGSVCVPNRLVCSYQRIANRLLRRTMVACFNAWVAVHHVPADRENALLIKAVRKISKHTAFRIFYAVRRPPLRLPAIGLPGWGRDCHLDPPISNQPRRKVER
eukprot:SAG11_NODE_411_length_9696_cov_46.841513_8_plen_105_part_00